MLKNEEKSMFLDVDEAPDLSKCVCVYVGKCCLWSNVGDSICLLVAGLGAYKSAATWLLCYANGQVRPFVVSLGTSDSCNSTILPFCFLNCFYLILFYC